MKTNEPRPPGAPVGLSEDMETVRRSSTADYDGTTQFARMIPRERLRWLDLAVDFVSRHAGGKRLKD